MACFAKENNDSEWINLVKYLLKKCDIKKFYILFKMFSELCEALHQVRSRKNSNFIRKKFSDFADGVDHIFG